VRRKLHGQSNQGTEVSQAWYVNGIEDFVEFKDNLNPGNVFCAYPCSFSFKYHSVEGNKNRNQK